MNLQTLKVITSLRKLSGSDLAKMAGVSRQAVSLWFQKGPNANIQSTHLINLTRALNIPSDTLLHSLPILDNLKQKKELEGSLLWDRLYPSLEDFVVALIQKKTKALSRLVEVYGLFQSEKMMGKVIWILFPKYKKYLPPVRRKQCEKIWNLNPSSN